MNLTDIQAYWPHFLVVFISLTTISLGYHLYTTRNTFVPYEGPEPQSQEKASAKSLSLYGDSISVPCAIGELMPNIWSHNFAIADSCLTDLIDSTLLGRTIENQIPNDYSAVQLMRYGCNDARFNRDFKLYCAMLSAFVIGCRNANKVPVLCSFTNEIFKDNKGKRRWEQYNNAIKEIAARLEVHFIDLTSVPYDLSELPDGTHPNAVYNARVDAFIVKFFKDKNIFTD